MKRLRKTLRLFIAMLMTTGISMAHAQTQVTVYGRLDASIEQVSVSLRTGPTRHYRLLSSDGSRLGFRATENLGQGWRALVNLEQGFALDRGHITEGGTAWGRQATVGISGPWGAVYMGRNYLPMDDDTWYFDAFNYAGLGVAWMFLPYESRASNSVKYVSPKLDGFVGEAMVAAGEGQVASKQLGFSALYKQPAFDVKAAYTLTKGVVGNNDRREYLLAADVKFGGPRLMAIVYQGCEDGVADDMRSYVLGGSWPVGAAELRLSVASLSQGDDRSRRWALGYWYNFSRRTALYAAFARQTNSQWMGLPLNPSFVIPPLGATLQGTQLGIRHSF